MIGGEQAAVLTSDWLWQDHKERCIYTQANGIMGGDSDTHQWANGNCATALGVICEAVGQVRTNQNPAPGHVTPVLTSDWQTEPFTTGPPPTRPPSIPCNVEDLETMTWIKRSVEGTECYAFFR